MLGELVCSLPISWFIYSDLECTSSMRYDISRLVCVLMFVLDSFVDLKRIQYVIVFGCVLIVFSAAYEPVFYLCVLARVF